ncbi:hypothetical protein HY798_00855 [Candidatus Falkowbacteria bacterium]|nr:hypothetical protein [Candidatus Falkowbacteria bacterium]
MPLDKNAKVFTVLLGIAVILILVCGAAFYYSFFFKSRLVQRTVSVVRIVSSEQLQEREIENISILIGDDPAWYKKTRLLFLDVRSGEEYVKEHLKNSMSLPVDKMQQFLQPEEVSLAVYSSRDELLEAEKVAGYLDQKNRDFGRAGMVGEIYLIGDGFEGLKSAGLPTESGFFD